MKNSKLILAAGLLTVFLVANRFADSSLASKNEVSVYKQIEQQMPYPEFAKERQLIGKVLVEFKFDEKGQIQIMNMNFSNNRLKEYVVDRLSQMNILLPADAIEKVYAVEFSFNMVS